MLGEAKQKMAERVMSQVTPSETPVARALVGTLTAYEADQADALSDLADAAGLDVTVEYNREARAQTLLDLADAVADRRVVDWWFDAVAPELLDNPEQARQYVGIDGAEWFDQIRRWHNQYHEAGVVDAPVSEAEPGEIGRTADRHIRETFGVDLATFVAIVINWDRGEQIQPVLGGPIERNNQLIREAAEAIDE